MAVGEYYLTHNYGEITKIDNIPVSQEITRGIDEKVIISGQITHKITLSTATFYLSGIPLIPNKLGPLGITDYSGKNLTLNTSQQYCLFIKNEQTQAYNYIGGYTLDLSEIKNEKLLVTPMNNYKDTTDLVEITIDDNTIGYLQAIRYNGISYIVLKNDI